MENLCPLMARMYRDYGVPYSDHAWQGIGPDDFRLYPQRGCLRLWRKTYHAGLYGGYKIQTVVADSGLAREWLESAYAIEHGN